MTSGEAVGYAWRRGERWRFPADSREIGLEISAQLAADLLDLLRTQDRVLSAGLIALHDVLIAMDGDSPLPPAQHDG